MVGDVRRIALDGDVATLEVYWRATHTGPLATSYGVLPPGGARLEAWSTMWLTWSRDVVVHERNHIDALSMLARLGALPAPAHP